MSNDAIKKIGIWIYSAVAAGVGGVGSAVSAFIAGQTIGALNFTPRQIGAIAIGGAITAVAAYLKTSPLPSIDGLKTSPLPSIDGLKTSPLPSIDGASK